MLVGSNILKGKGTTLISSQVEPYILINKNIQYRTVQTNSTSLWNIIFRLQNNLCFFYFVLNIQNNLSFLILFWIFCFFYSSHCFCRTISIFGKLFWDNFFKSNWSVFEFLFVSLVWYCYTTSYFFIYLNCGNEVALFLSLAVVYI